MKKWLLVFTGLFIVLLALTYLWIPNYISIRANTRIIATESGIKRELIEIADLAKWWPDDQGKHTGDSSLFFHGTRYRVSDKNFGGIVLAIETSSKKIKSLMNIVPVEPDTVRISWEARMATSWNPFKRWQVYFSGQQLKKDMQVVLDTMQHYYNDPAHIYGFVIRREAVKDSNLIFTSGISQGYPSMEFVYKLIGKLKSYAASQQAKENNYPMLNILTQDSITFTTKVALPVNRMLKSSGDISYKWMLGGGNILVADIKGGNSAIQNAFHQFEHYLIDYKFTAPAIPFQSLVTNRLQEPDSSKWITRIYYPVI